MSAITSISKNRPEHISLDFDLLRAEGIQHLESLATEVWTDFNAHDPGITMLELLCYAITDLGYRTRMLPIEDILAGNDSSKKNWFAVTEVLPNAPVTERDFRKLIIDVKGVKNAWLRKARPEEIVMMLYRIGWAFPQYMDGPFQWDETKLMALAKELNVPYPENGSSNSIRKCIEAYFAQFELDPKLSIYEKAITALGGIDKLKQVELETYFTNVQKGKPFFDISHLVVFANQYFDHFTKGAEFPVYPAEYKPAVTAYLNQYENYEDFKNTGFDKDVKAFGFNVIKNKQKDLIEFLTDSKILDKNTTAYNYDKVAKAVTAFMVEIKDDLPAYRNDDRLLEVLANNEVPLTKDQSDEIKSYVLTQNKVVSETETGIIKGYLSGVGTNTSNGTALTALWEAFKKAYDESGNILWADIESAEFERLVSTLSKAAKSRAKSAKAASGVELEFTEFKKIVKDELPRADYFVQEYSTDLLEQYAIPGTTQLTLSNQALSSFLLAAFNLSNAQATVTELLNYSEENPSSKCTSLGNHLIDNLCKNGFYALTTSPDKANPKFKDYPIPLNGIYQIILDLDDDINTANPKQVEAVVSRAMRRLHANRALCEDFLQPQIVEQRPVHFCIHLEVSTDMDERAVMAEVIWRFQEYLTPTLRFHNFKEMYDLGVHCDEIYNGPLLTHGFLLDSEVDAAQLVEEYYHSDLVRIAMNTPGVLGVRELKVKATPEGKVLGSNGLKLSDGPTYSVYPEITPNKLASPAPFLKRVIDLCESCFFVSKGALPAVQLNDKVLQEHLEYLNLTRNCALCSEPGGHVPTVGLYRPDLADYRSVQYDLPDVFTVGENTVLDNAPPHRKAQARQLQAYLAFYDQILASYLAQLGQVNQLLSINQDIHGPTRVLSALYEVPGVRELIEYQAVFTSKAEDWTIILGNVPDSDRNAVRAALGNIATSSTKFEGFYAFRQQLESALGAKQYASYGALFSNFFWGKYIQDEANNYRMALAAAAETPAHRQQHRNRLLNHLLARFGESFGTYVHALLLPDVEPEDNPWRQDFDDYLEDKARFLREVAALSHDRGRGYNYRKMIHMSHHPDVWNTDNVAGVKKRVSRLVGIDGYTQKSLIAEPPYRLDIVQKQNQQGNAQFRIVLKKRPEAVDSDDNPLETGPLMHSIRYSSKKKAQDKVTELYKNIWKSSYFKAQVSDSDPDKWVVKFTLPDNELQSDALGEEEAKGLLALLLDLVKPGNAEVEGFHLVEHILLRPNDPKDQLLQIPLGCDPKETPFDPYSFWITVILPDWTSRFKHADFRYFFEQTFRAETPSHIAIRFCWVDLDTMYRFEDAFRKWLIEKARCTPDECHVTEAANALVQLLNTMPCTCHCAHDLPEDLCDDCGKPATHR